MVESPVVTSKILVCDAVSLVCSIPVVCLLRRLFSPLHKWYVSTDRFVSFGLISSTSVRWPYNVSPVGRYTKMREVLNWYQHDNVN